jgi:integrase/recombinase XerD
MNSWVESYLAALTAEHFSQELRRNSERALSGLILYLTEAFQIESWQSVETWHLRGYLIFLANRHEMKDGKKLAPSSLRQTTSRVRRFFAWLTETNRLLHNPAENLELSKQPNTLPQVLSEAEIARLIEEPDTRTAFGVRDRAILETLYATGLRRGEMYRLNLVDVDTGARTLRVGIGKTRRERIVPLTENAAEWLTKYMTSARNELLAGQYWGKGKSRQPKKTLAPVAALWLSMNGRRLSIPRLWATVKKYADAANVNASPHVFRHSMATHLLRHGASIRHIQKLLGHRNLETTEIYTQVEISDLQKTVKKAKRNLSSKGGEKT